MTELKVETFQMGTDKGQAVKVLEEAAEVFGAWQRLDLEYRGVNDGKVCLSFLRMRLADELADVIQAACNVAVRYGLDMQAAMRRCEERNRKRGRYE